MSLWLTVKLSALYEFIVHLYVSAVTGLLRTMPWFLQKQPPGHLHITRDSLASNCTDMRNTDMGSEVIPPIINSGFLLEI